MSLTIFGGEVNAGFAGLVTGTAAVWEARAVGRQGSASAERRALAPVSAWVSAWALALVWVLPWGWGRGLERL